MEQPEGLDANREQKPGCGCFLIILTGITAMYVLHIICPGRREAANDWIARQPTGKEFLGYFALVVVSLSVFLWGGFYLFGKRFLRVLYWGVMLFAALTGVGYVIVIVGILLGLKR